LDKSKETEARYINDYSSAIIFLADLLFGYLW
jgi:hypothetical protein